MAKVYVMDSASYNQGQIRGIWLAVDLGSTAEDLKERIKSFLAETQGEEWTIEGHEGLAGYEGSDLSQICAIVDAIEEFDQDIVEGYFIGFGYDADLAKLADRYMGRYESAAEYCEEIYALPPKIANFQIFDGDIEFYIDWEAVARDAQVNHITVHEVVGSEVHIYSK